MTYLFCAYRDWAKELYKLLSKRHKNMILIKNPKQLTVNYVEKINPKFIFFPDWSWIVPDKILGAFVFMNLIYQNSEVVVLFKTKSLEVSKRQKLLRFL